MFNFSANHLNLVESKDYEKARITILKDSDTNRCYKVYDYRKAFIFEQGRLYSISGKVNSADKIYLVLETAKEFKACSIANVHRALQDA